MKRVIVASHNKKKIKELAEILSGYGYEPVSRDDAGIDKDFEVVEDGETFEENSFKKASQICELSGEIAIADDSGLMVDALGGAPGVYSSRYSGKDGDDEANNEKLLRELRNVPEDKRNAKFVTVITLCYPDGNKILAKGEVHGKIANDYMGKDGFGYDPLFIPDGYDTTFGVLGAEVKHKISHRANAIKELDKKIKNANQK